MNQWSPLTIGMAAGAAVLLISAAVLAYRRLRRRKDPAELERLRRAFLSRSGRIATGEIVGLVEPEGTSAVLAVYRYDVGGVTYEVSQDVSALPEIGVLVRRALGGITSIRYEVKHPSNSIIVSEVWSGLLEVRPSGGSAQSSSEETAEKQT